ncbi:hypothetical protein [Uliginosibacterium gangwonense]|uniref:hypothetical protein n=1 Tax=Uliginosibacterium gangwonense TaxID=392736 RepID=UPI000367450A|nr:hypothetical protein [Uliginosibacterium gangwonense]
MKRLMYIENKAGGLDGPGRIGWVTFSRSLRSMYYAGRVLQKIKSGYKYNCFDVETGEDFWISGPKKNGQDKLYGGIVEIDEDAREQYWTEVRQAPECVHLTRYRG